MTIDGQLRDWLDSLAQLGGVVSSLEVVVAGDEEILFRHASGYRVGGERLLAGSGARFDAASLTKPWMATLALALDAAGELPLGTRLPGGTSTTLEDLLRHRAGLPAWTPLALRLGRRLGDAGALRAFLLNDVGQARGESTYSDLGFVLWGLLAEESAGRDLGAMLDERVCAPLGIAGVGELSAEPPNAVECRLDNGKEVALAAAQGLGLSYSRSFFRGVPQDGNARALRDAGLSPAHAGLFVTADEMLALAREWLTPGRLLVREQVESALAGGGSRALGWERWSADGSSGPALGRSSFGHTGFVGHSLWIDPERRRIYLLLAHRLSSAIDFQPYRREFHRLAVEAIGAD